MSIPLSSGRTPEDLVRRLTELRAGTFQGRDPARLALAVIDGDGLVVRVEFAASVGRHQPAEVESAVTAALAAARDQLTAALAELARDADAVTVSTPEPNAAPDPTEGPNPARAPEPGAAAATAGAEDPATTGAEDPEAALDATTMALPEAVLGAPAQPRRSSQEEAGR